jgi:hypothetical protein
VTERFRNQHRATLFELVEALDLQKKYADVDSLKKQAKNKKDDYKKNNGNGNGNGKGSHFHRKQGAYKRNGSKRKYDPNAKDGKPHNDPNRPCWKANHQNHKWGDCFQNPSNPNNKLGQHPSHRVQNTSYHAQMPPPAVIHVPPCPPSVGYPSSNSVVSTTTPVANVAYYYTPSMEHVPPRGHGTYIADSMSGNHAQSYFVQDSRETTCTAYHHLNASAAHDAFTCPKQADVCNEITALCHDLFENSSASPLSSFPVFPSTTPTTTPSTLLLADLAPSILFVPRFIQQHQAGLPLISLLDPGSNVTFIHRRTLPPGAVPLVLSTQATGNTIAGTFNSKNEVWLDDIILPEFTRSRHIKTQRALVFDTPCPYDVILGRDFLRHTGIDVKFSTNSIVWENLEAPMKPPNYWNHDTIYLMLVDPEFDCFASTTPILDSKYEEIDPFDVAAQQSHLSLSQKEQLAGLLSKFSVLFNGELGFYPHQKVHLIVDSSLPAPKFHKAYPVPRLHLDTFKKELNRLVDIGVLSRVTGSPYCFPTFIIPKKDGRVRWVSDFRDLNKILKRRTYPLPNIMDILTRRTGYSYFTKLDISMQYYTFELDEASSNLCIINTPFGLFRYNRLPMGVTVAPDFAQEVMDNIFRDLSEVDVYLDDVGVFNSDWDAHLTSLHKVLHLLETNGFTVNPLKCEWGKQETDWLGYWLTPTGLKPWQKKIDAIKRMQPPTNLTELRSFLGSVNYYRDMWPRRSHILAPLTDLTSKSPFTWTARHQQAFDDIKSLIIQETLLAYPDPNKPFHIYADASEYQLGAAILQDDRPVAFYSRKLSPSQRNYTTIEKELLSIVETFKSFRSLLYGNPQLHVYTDHRNLTYANLQTQRVLRWRLFLEEFAPTFHYIPGPDNVLADALSRLPSLDGKNTVNTVIETEMDAFVNYPDTHTLAFPSFALLHQHQQQDAELQAARQAQPDKYPLMQIGQFSLIVYLKEPNTPWRIVIPDSLLDHIIHWYHLSLNHAGMSNLIGTISQHHFHRNLKDRVEYLVNTCETCLRYKPLTRGYGELPSKTAPLAPWNEVAIDLIGPWTLQVQDQQHQFRALTCIDPVTNLTELIRIESKESLHVSQLFANCWLSRYPRPNRCVHDNGGEFTGFPFQELLRQHHIKDVPTTVKNPQANAVCERMHKTVATLLRLLSNSQPLQHYHQAVHLVDTALAKAMHSLRSTYNRTLGMSPGGLVFQRDMILDIPTIGDLNAIHDRRQLRINENLRLQNDRRFDYDYQVGGQVLLLLSNADKLGPLTSGPYPIEQVHANGTLTIRRSPYVSERINIRRVRPFHS